MLEHAMLKLGQQADAAKVEEKKNEIMADVEQDKTVLEEIEKGKIVNETNIKQVAIIKEDFSKIQNKINNIQIILQPKNKSGLARQIPLLKETQQEYGDITVTQYTLISESKVEKEFDEFQRSEHAQPEIELAPVHSVTKPSQDGKLQRLASAGVAATSTQSTSKDPELERVPAPNLLRKTRTSPRP